MYVSYRSLSPCPESDGFNTHCVSTVTGNRDIGWGDETFWHFYLAAGAESKPPLNTVKSPGNWLLKTLVPLPAFRVWLTPTHP